MQTSDVSIMVDHDTASTSIPHPPRAPCHTTAITHALWISLLLVRPPHAIRRYEDAVAESGHTSSRARG